MNIATLKMKKNEERLEEERMDKDGWRTLD